MQWAYTADGQSLWIPSYDFYGTIEGESDSPAYPLSSVYAVVDDQIDLSQFQYGYGVLAGQGLSSSGVRD